MSPDAQLLVVLGEDEPAARKGGAGVLAPLCAEDMAAAFGRHFTNTSRGGGTPRDAHVSPFRAGRWVRREMRRESCLRRVTDPGVVYETNAVE